MRKASKLVLVALAATTLLALVAGEASARSFSVDEKNFELIWDNTLVGKTKLTFTDTSRKQISCKVTLLGRFLEHTIVKQTRTRIATLNHGVVSECAGGTAEVRGFPWEVYYRGFRGMLPRIEAITLAFVGERWRIESGGLNCEAATEATNPAIGIIEAFNMAGGPRNIKAEERTTIPLEGFVCAFVTPGQFEGLGLILNLPTDERIFITLI